MPHCQRYLEEHWRTSSTHRVVVVSPVVKIVTAGAAAAFGGEKRAE